MIPALLLAVGAWLAVPVPASRLDRMTARPRPKRASWLGPVLVAVVVLAAVGVIGGVELWLMTIAGSAPVGTALWVVRRRLAARRRSRDRTAVARACSIVAGQLRSGRMPEQALAAAASECPILSDAAGLVAVGGDPVALWLDQAKEPGSAGLGPLARAWALSMRTGAPMAEALGAVADALRRDADVQRTVEAELAAPLMTSRLLAALPLAGIAIGYAIGGDPIAFLTGSVAGGVCLMVGAVLACAGVVWTERIAARATR